MQLVWEHWTLQRRSACECLSGCLRNLASQVPEAEVAKKQISALWWPCLRSRPLPSCFSWLHHQLRDSENESLFIHYFPHIVLVTSLPFSLKKKKRLLLSTTCYLFIFYGQLNRKLLNYAMCCRAPRALSIVYHPLHNAQQFLTDLRSCNHSEFNLQLIRDKMNINFIPQRII